MFAYDETNINLNMHSASHQKVINATGTPPLLYVSDQDRYVTLATFISDDGWTFTPALLYPQHKYIPVANRKAWDDACGRADTLHIAAGRTAFMNKFFFHEVFEHFAAHIRLLVDRTIPVVVLMDGCSSHYNARTCLRMQEENILLFVYSSQITKHVAPPDDESVFGAFQRDRRRRLNRAGGAPSIASGLEGAAEAFNRTMTKHNILRAFEKRGFARTEDRFKRQARVKEKVVEQQRSAHWLAAQRSRVDFGEFIAGLPFQRRRTEGRHLTRPRRPLGPCVPATGVLNSRKRKMALVAELRRVVSERKRIHTDGEPSE